MGSNSRKMGLKAWEAYQPLDAWYNTSGVKKQLSEAEQEAVQCVLELLDKKGIEPGSPVPEVPNNRTRIITFDNQF